MKLQACILVLLQCMFSVQSARILGVFPIAGKSLNILYNKLMMGLADAGHDVTVISAYPNRQSIKNGSFTDVLLTGFAENYEKMIDDLPLLETPDANSFREVTNFYYIFLHVYKETVRHPNVLRFLKEDHHFDLVITEYLWGESMFGFAEIFRCPLAVFSSMGGVVSWVHPMVGNHLPVSYVPHALYNSLVLDGPTMTLGQRFYNLLFYLYDQYHLRFVAFPQQDALYKRLNPNGSSVANLFYTPSLILMGSHVSIRQSTPIVPNIVEIGGFHIDPPKKLPDDLQGWLDGATEGVIYFSMGSHLKSKSFSAEKKRTFLNVFRKLGKTKVLWKYEDDTLEGKPDNVAIRKWLPQMDILAHPNVKLFISHGGYGSTLETVYHGVPTLMIPIFADQVNNAKQAQSLGYALTLRYNDDAFTEETLHRMVAEMLKNPTYRNEAKRLSALFHDRPMKPLETAIYWIEYVIRHKGADHLKVAGVKLPWYQFYMLDVLLVLYIALFVISTLFARLLRALFCRRDKSKSRKLKTQ